MPRILKRVAILVAALIVVAVLVLVARVALYRQTDDEEHLASKRDYLARIAGAGTPLRESPNLVLILFDDLGYGDLGAYGGEAIRTPNIDLLAAQGAMFRHAYAASPYCSASRAGLMTGRYAVRCGLDHVLQPRGTFYDVLLKVGGRNRRLPAEEITLAEVLKAAGYATGLFGKWHLGDESPSLPVDLGFDSFYGMLHSNDLGKPRVWRNREPVEEHPVDQTTLTRRYTERAVAFIREHRDRPFFLYLPHTFPHIPLHAPGDARGRSDAGLYGDVVEELDRSVGAVVEALAGTDTLVIVSSDNGPWFQGSPGGTRGRKFDVFEGGMRVPLIAHRPGRIPEGQVIDEPVIFVDLLPTVLEMLGLPAPEDRVLDGRSILPLLEGREAGPHVPIYFYQLGELRAARRGPFKYHRPHGVFFGNPMDWSWGPMRRRGPWLFDLSRDPDESYDVSDRHPGIAGELRELIAAREAESADNPRGWR